jgi:hypothetical protein
MFCERRMSAAGAPLIPASVPLSAPGAAPRCSTVPEPGQGPLGGSPAQGGRLGSRKFDRSEQPERFPHGEEVDWQRTPGGSLKAKYGPTVNPFGNWEKAGAWRGPEPSAANTKYGPTVDPFG